MAELKRNFLQGKMDLDLDDRILSPGVYRYGQNVSVARSTTADVGSLENALGNNEIRTPFQQGSGYQTIGAVTDELNNKIYWFALSDVFEGIFEYDVENSQVNRVLEFPRSKRIFQFSERNLITGANIIGDLLYWTDGLNPPRKINIQRYVSSPQLETGTESRPIFQTIQVGAGSYFLPNDQGEYHITDDVQVEVRIFGPAGEPPAVDGQTDFVLADIPDTATSKAISSVVINEVAVDEDDYSFNTETDTLTLDTGLNGADEYNVRIGLRYVRQLASERANGPGNDARLLSTRDPEFDNNAVPLVDLTATELNLEQGPNESDASFEERRNAYVQQPAFHGDLINVAKRPPLTPPLVVTPSQTVPAPSSMTTQTITADGINTVFVLQDLIDVENPMISLTVNGSPATIVNANTGPSLGFAYSSEVGRNNFFNAVEAAPDAGATLVITYNAIQSFDASTRSARDGEFLYDNYVYFSYRYIYRDGEVSALSPFSIPAFFPEAYRDNRNTGDITSMVNTISVAEIAYDVGPEEVTEVELVVTSARDLTVKSLATINKAELGDQFRSSTPYNRNIQLFEYDNNKVYSTLPSSEISRLFDDVPIRAQSQEIIGNRLVYGNYIQNYNLERLGMNDNGVRFPLAPNFVVDYSSTPRTADDLSAACSVKSDRDYQVGIVYLDAEGRQTPVLLSDGAGGNSSLYIPFNDPTKPGTTHLNNNKITVNIQSPAPLWATHYRFFIKQVQGDYHNILPKRVTRSGYRAIIQLDSSDRNKLGPDSTLVIKGIGDDIRDTKSVWRVDPYVQRANGDNSFSIRSDNNGGFEFLNDTEGLVIFDVPFEEAQDRTNNSFAPLATETDEEVFEVSGRSYEIEEDEDWENITVTSVEIDGNTVPTTDYTVTGRRVLFNTAPTLPPTINFTYQIQDVESPARNDYYLSIVPVESDDVQLFDSTGSTLTVLETIPSQENVADIYYEHGETFRCFNGQHTSSTEEVVRATDQVQEIYTPTTVTTPLPIVNGVQRVIGDPVVGQEGQISLTLNSYFNCFTYPTGIEENSIRGEFNEISLLPGIRASTTNEAYRQRQNSSFLIHSGLFNETTSLNRLNEFNPTFPITTELDISDGSIQKLHGRDTNLIVFQEDKVKNVPINKNLVQSAAGSGALTTQSNFFGTESSYSGEYGISENPESFTTYGDRIYFADKNRGALCRLSSNGIEEISQQGAESYIRNTLEQADLIYGSYDYFHDQCHFSFDNYRMLEFRPNETSIFLDSYGSPDPRSECNRDETLLTFVERFAYIGDSVNGVQEGDIIFLDMERRITMNGNYRWYRIQDPTGTAPDRWDRAIQVSPFGVVTGVEGMCAINRPPDIARDSFDISAVGFSNEDDACANGIIDDQAYHNGEGTEPIVGNIIFEGRWDRIRSTRTGWYIISAGTEKDVIELCNGEVLSRVSCASISRKRTSILGSNPIPLNAGTDIGELLDEICTEPFAEQVYWYDSDDDLPVAGEILYTTNHNDEVVEGNRYYSFPGGHYVRVDENSTIEAGFPTLCSEKICWINPAESVSIENEDGTTVNFLTQGENVFDFTFNGIQRNYAFTTSGNTVTQFSSIRNINNVEIEYVVQGERRYPRSGTFRVNAQEIIDDDNTRYFYDMRVSDENTDTILDGDVITPLILGSVGSDGAFTAETISLPQPNSASLSENTYPDYDQEDPDNIRVNVTRLCYRIGNVTGVGTAWVTAAVTSNNTGTICGNTALDAVFYDRAIAANAGRRFFETQDVNPETGISWGQGANGNGKTGGVYGISYIEPRMAPEDNETDCEAAGHFWDSDSNTCILNNQEGGGVVRDVATISNNGTIVSSFRCVNNNDTFLIDLGMAPPTANITEQLRACNVARANLLDRLVSVYSDQPLSNFSDNPPDATTSPGNPPTRFQQGNGLPVADGYYTDGTTIRLVTNGVVGPREANGCSFSLTAQLTVNNEITNDSTVSGSPIPRITLRTDQGTSRQWTNNTDGNTLQDTGQLGDMWELSTIVQLPVADPTNAPNGYEWVERPRFFIDSSATGEVLNNDTSVWTGEFNENHAENGPTRVLRITGTIGENDIPPPPPTTYTVQVNVSNSIPNSSLSIGSNQGHPRSGSGSTYFFTVPIASSGSVSVSVSPNSRYRFTGTPVVNGTRSSSIQFNYSPSSRGPFSANFSGNTELAPEERTFTLSASTSDTTRTRATGDSDTITGGSTTLTANLAAVSGWRIVSSNPGSLSQSETFNFNDTPRSRSVQWTNVVAQRYSHTLNEVSGAAAGQVCPTSSSSVTVFTDNASPFSGNIYPNATATTRTTGTRQFIVGNTIHNYNNGTWTNFTCEDEPDDPWVAVSYSTGTSDEGACNNTSGTVRLFVNPNDSNNFATNADGTGTPNSSLHYAIGFTIYSFNSSGDRTRVGLCPGVYVNGTRRGSNSTAATVTIGGNSRTRDTVEIVGVTATFTPSGRVTSAFIGPNNDASVGVIWNINGTELEAAASGVAGGDTLTFRPRSIEIGPGTRFSIDSTTTSSRAFGVSTVTVTYS